MYRRRKESGLTLIELLVVISIIGILAGVVLVNVGQGSAQSRDTERQSDIRAVETALERYRLKYGRYPEGCNGPNVWSGQTDSGYPCPGNSPEYILGDLSNTTSVTENFAPEFIQALPKDSVVNGVNSGYVYTVDSTGSVYKFMALNSVESEVVTIEHEFARCGQVQTDRGRYTVFDECSISPNEPSGTGGTYTYNQTGSNPNGWNGNACTSPEMDNDYAISAGYADYSDEKAQEYYTDRVRCK